MTNFFHQVTDTLSHLSGMGVMIAVFAVATLAFWLVVRRWNRRPATLAQRLDELEKQLDAEEERGTLFEAIAPALAATLPESKKERSEFQKLLRGAGMYRPGAAQTIYAMRFVFLFAPLMAAAVLAIIADRSATLAIALGGAALAGFLSITPRLYVYFRRRQRSRAIRHGLPDTMDMLSMCIGGGMGLSLSLDHVARQLTSFPELAEELLILKRQAEVGSLKHALADFAARVDLPEVRQLAGLLTRGERLGTKLAGSLIEHSDHLRNTRKQMATQQANKTPVKLVLPLMFCFAPAALLMLISPALLELKEFVAPMRGQSVLSNNTALDTRPIISALNNLDQDMSAARQ